MTKTGSTTSVTLASRATATLAAAALSATAMAACSSDPEPKSQPKASTAATTVPPTTPISAAAATNPLTGVGRPPAGPVIAVKIDDTSGGRPGLGLDKADVIYIGEAEGGLTRMVGVFASSKPKVRAVRSVRSSDPELLAQYGRIILVASGGAGGPLRVMDKSPLHPVIQDRGQVGFYRDGSRPAPYNVVCDLAKVSAKVKADGVRDVGFRWGASDPRLAGARPAATVSTRVGATRVGFVWDAKTRKYVRTVEGRRLATAGGAPVAKPNVLVQFSKVRPDHSTVDAAGNIAAFTRTVGTGRVVLFRGGKRIEGTWIRGRAAARTEFRDKSGKQLLFAPGGMFVALARPGSPA